MKIKKKIYLKDGQTLLFACSFCKGGKGSFIFLANKDKVTKIVEPSYITRGGEKGCLVVFEKGLIEGHAAYMFCNKEVFRANIMPKAHYVFEEGELVVYEQTFCGIGAKITKFSPQQNKLSFEDAFEYFEKIINKK